MIAVVGTPGAGLGRVVEHGVEAGERGQHRLAVGEVATQLFDAVRIERRIVAAVEARDFMPALDQAAAQGLA